MSVLSALRGVTMFIVLACLEKIVKIERIEGFVTEIR